MNVTSTRLLPVQPGLRRRLEQFDFGDSNARLTFVQRLARENHWSIAFATRVVAEYKRFLELAMVAGHPVTPSEAVDQAWHLHMVYTQSYWEDLCGHVLGRPLHHGPTRGGSNERTRYEDQYQKTLDAYQRIFGEQPPAEIWPDSEERFRQSMQTVRVDRGRFWVIAKPSWFQVAGAGGLASAPLLAAAMNPFDLGPMKFLLLYFILAIAALVLGICYRYSLIRAEANESVDPGRTDTKPTSVGWAALAMLTGGGQRAMMAALVRLRADGKVNLVKNRLAFVGSRSGASVESQSTVLPDTKDDTLYLQGAETLIMFDPKGVKLSRFAQQMRAEHNRLSVVLEQHGLWRSVGDQSIKAISTAGPLLVVMLIGVIRLIIGISKERPIGYLIVMLIATLIVTTILIASFPRRTARGKALADQWPGDYPVPVGNAATSSKNEMVGPYLIALHGTAALSAMTLGNDAVFYQTLDDYSKQLAAGGTASSFGDGGGCGGGGCGGGGCGGCGGCGG